MHEIPEKIDIEKVSQACDAIMKYMRDHAHYLDAELIDQMGTVFAFVHRVKFHAE